MNDAKLDMALFEKAVKDILLSDVKAGAGR